MLRSLKALTGRPTQPPELSTDLCYLVVVRCHSVSNSAARVTIIRATIGAKVASPSTGATAIGIGIVLNIAKPVRNVAPILYLVCCQARCDAQVSGPPVGLALLQSTSKAKSHTSSVWRLEMLDQGN